MSLTLTQVFLASFLLFAISRVLLRFKDGEVSLVGLFFWESLFSAATILVLWPGLTSNIAKTLGIGRGADVVVYTSIVLLFYLVFRLYVYLEDLRHEITKLVRKIALNELNKKNGKKSSKD